MCRWLCVLGIEYRHVPVEEVRFYVKRDDGHTSFKSHTALKRRGGSNFCALLVTCCFSGVFLEVYATVKSQITAEGVTVFVTVNPHSHA